MSENMKKTGGSSLMSERTTMSESMKKTGGRRRIPIQKIANKTSRSVTFSKRRAGLFSKANELATMCGSEIAVVVFSETGKPSAFGAESAIRRFLQESDSSNSLLPHPTIATQPDTQSAFGGSAEENADELLWKSFICSLGLDELKLYANFLQSLRDLIPTSASPSSSTYNGVTGDEGSLLMEGGGYEQQIDQGQADAEFQNYISEIQWEDDGLDNLLASFLG